MRTAFSFKSNQIIKNQKVRSEVLFRSSKTLECKNGKHQFFVQIEPNASLVKV